jgi:hypothetical protein
MVVGDDVAITNKDLALLYEEVMVLLGVTVSKSKTIISKTVTEFVGHLITADQIVPTVKYRKISDRNFLDVVKTFGLSIVPELQPMQRKIAKVLAYLPEPYGLGFNPLGLSLKQRQGQVNDISNFLSEHVLAPHLDEQATRYKLRPRDLFHPNWEGRLDSVPELQNYGYTVGSKRKVDKTLRGVSSFLEQLKTVYDLPVLMNIRDILLRDDLLSLEEKVDIYERLVNAYTFHDISGDPRGASQLHRYQHILLKDQKTNFIRL